MAQPDPPQSTAGTDRGGGPAWLTPRARRWLRYNARLGRVVTTIDLFSAELDASPDAAGVPGAAGDGPWRATADRLLDQAREAVAEGRIDDGWDFLHAAQRQALLRLTPEQAQLAAVALRAECESKLAGWRRQSALEILGVPSDPGGDSGAHPTRSINPTGPTGSAGPVPNRPVTVAQLAAVRRLLDEHSHTMYLRLRLVGHRLATAAGLLAVVLVVLGLIVAVGAADRPAMGSVTVLQQGGEYVTVALLGALGALLSFALGTKRTGPTRRIYQLASGRYAAVAARILIGVTGGIVAAVAVQSEFVALPAKVVPIVAVAAGFSERMVSRIVDSLSAAAETPR